MKILILILLADLATGFFHFYVDQYGKMDSKYMTVSINGLLIHHSDPRKMVGQSYWELTKGVYKIGTVIFIVSLFFGFYWELLFFLLISAQANMIHKWAHQKDSETHVIVLYLQKLKIFQSKQHHGKHHAGKYDCYYCVMTNVLNPVLQKIFFWEGIIKLLGFFGVHTVHELKGNR